MTPDSLPTEPPRLRRDGGKYAARLHETMHAFAESSFDV